VSLPPESLRVRGDPVRLEQVVVNLLNNAVKYTDPGGDIRLTAGREEGAIVLCVQDNGIGIAPDMLSRIFDPFVQAERRMDRARGGVGIGLTLVKRLVELHGGSIEARSPGLGRGSEFIVRLRPLAGDVAGTATPASARSGPAAPPRRILVVDDSPDSANSLALFLRLSGQDVRTAYDGPSARSRRRSSARGGLPRHWHAGHGRLPGGQELRRCHGPEELLLASLTGWGQAEDWQRCREAGFDHHFVKPIDLKAIEALLVSLNAKR
jgi:CheY-like chemotaxis protein